MSEWKAIQIGEAEWKEKFSENFHKLVFKEVKPAFRDRISYALLVVKAEEAIGYVTVREMDDENVYWQFGGVIPKFQKSMTAVKCIETAILWQKEHSKRITTYVENTNLPMLRFYLSYGFLVVGTRTYLGHLMVDLIKELHGN
jgi:ribosomal protein S18 acetylase RimI-like enzyme